MCESLRSVSVNAVAAANPWRVACATTKPASARGKPSYYERLAQLDRAFTSSFARLARKPSPVAHGRIERSFMAAAAAAARCNGPPHKVSPSSTSAVASARASGRRAIRLIYRRAANRLSSALRCKRIKMLSTCCVLGSFWRVLPPEPLKCVSVCVCVWADDSFSRGSLAMQMGACLRVRNGSRRQVALPRRN